MPRMRGPEALARILNDADSSGPFLGVQDGEWILFTACGIAADSEILVRHADWGMFMRLCSEYAPGPKHRR